MRRTSIHHTRKPGKGNADTARILSEHDYQRVLKAKLLNFPKRSPLKIDGVPSQEFGRRYGSRKSERTERQKRRQSKQILTELVKTHIDPSQCPNHTPETQEPTKIELGADISFRLASETSGLKRELREAKDLVMKLRCQFFNEQEVCKNKMIKISALQQEVIKLKKTRTEKYIAHQKAEDILRAVFSTSQIKILLDKKKVSWQDDEVVQALVLRYMSKRAYTFLRTKMNYPLPSISMLQKWVSKFQVGQGILTDVVNFMKIAGPSLSTREKIVIIQFDEVRLTKTVEYDHKVDKVIGPHSYMQVVMVRGLFGKWKQPVFVDFDVQMTKDILFSIINCMNKAGYSVQAMVCDMDGGNRDLIDDLEITTEKTWFLAPRNNDRKIFCVVDAPHLLEVIRNWFADSGFVLENGSFASAAPIDGNTHSDDDDDDDDVSWCHEVDPRHLTVVRNEQHSLPMPSAVLPLTTASALSQHKSTSDPDTELATSNFFKIVNAWFEIMDGRTAVGEEIKCGYGLHVEEQDQKLDDMYHLMETTRCFGWTTLQLFQKYVMLSISSLKALLIELKKQLDVSYILTNRLNQNCLENFFCQIRNLGGSNDHPSPLDALSRIRIVVLEKHLDILEKDLNPASQDTDEYLTAIIYHKSGNTMPTKDLSVIPDIEQKCHTSVAEPTSPSSNTTSNSLAPLEHDDTSSLWLQELSNGNLMEPPPILRTQIKKWNEEFIKYNGGESLRGGEGLVQKLYETICSQYPDVDSDIIYKFVKIRTLIRMKFMITKISSEEHRKVNRKCKINFNQEDMILQES